MENKKFCRLCINVIEDTNFKVIDEYVREVITFVLKLDLEEESECVICLDCSTKLFTAFDFKSSCLYTEDNLSPYFSSEETSFVDLTGIFDAEVCRLCTQIGSEFIPLHEVKYDIIQKCVPELNFSLTKNPVICKICFDFLGSLSVFIAHCLDIQDNVKNTNNQSPQPSFEPYIKTEDIKTETEENELVGKEYVNETENIDSVFEETKVECIETLIKSEVNDLNFELNSEEYEREGKEAMTGIEDTGIKFEESKDVGYACMPEAKQERALWEDDTLREAMEALNSGMSQHKVSKLFGVPRSTLRYHVRTGSVDRRLGRKTKFLPALEEELVRHLIRFSEIGVPLTPKMAHHQFAVISGSPSLLNESQESVGRTWFRLFMKRHPKLAKYRVQPTHDGEPPPLQKSTMGDYFRKLNKTLDNLNIKNEPHRIFSMDEKGCPLTLHSGATALGTKYGKSVKPPAQSYRKDVTIVSCVNAAGGSVPPMIIFKGKHVERESAYNLPSGSVVKFSRGGFMTTELFITFIEHLAKYKASGSVLLMFNGERHHLDYRIIGAAELHDITLFCYPCNGTRELHPLDSEVYPAFKRCWDLEVLRSWDGIVDLPITKFGFCIIFSKVWPACVTPGKIQRGFRATGIYPFAPRAVTGEAFEVNIVVRKRGRTSEKSEALLIDK